jgi:hypothetical protein
MSMAKTWHLEFGDEVIAKLQLQSYEFPWIHATIVDSAKFERYRSYFSEIEGWSETPEFEALLTEIEAKGNFRLRDPDTGKVEEGVTLYASDDFATFRFAPFFVG